MSTLAPRLDLRQSQALVMTPQLQQAIKLLTLSNVEVEQFIAEAVERNPLLETGGDMTGEGERSPVPREIGGNPAGGRGGGSAQQSFSGDGGSALDRLVAPAIGLQGHLGGQARATLDGEPLRLALALIDEIEDSGYLATPLEEIATRHGAEVTAVEQALAAVQRFDPTGVGARSLAECMTLQAREADRYDPAMARLIDNLDMLAKGALPRLCRICGVDADDMREMVVELRGYDPRPGMAFSGGDAPAIVPDILVRERGAGWAIEINSTTLPRLLVNRAYYTELSGNGCDRNTKSWLADCLADANWLVRALDQRQRTIIRVATEIVRHQQGFFRHGVSRLRPLTLRQIADAVDMHESTISRVTSNKYLQCPRGMFELKYFFTSAIASTGDGEAASASAVKAAIRTLIDNEPAEQILSDDRLVDLLNEKGFDIARRTVAKYREALGIGSSVQRRRQKVIAG